MFRNHFFFSCFLFLTSVKTTLCEGGVPQRPVVFVTRPKLVDAIKQKLRSLGSDPGWVTVYGMAGCGKTVLTAEALRDHQLLEGTFLNINILKITRNIYALSVYGSYVILKLILYLA